MFDCCTIQGRRASAEPQAERRMDACRLCPRECGAKRSAGKHGICGVADTVLVARAALHMWEEPCISGDDGSGAVFFAGCPLRCVYCQNYEITGGKTGRELSASQLSDIFLHLQEQNAANINLVTAGHYAPQVAQALSLAKGRGLRIPVVYNSSGYEKVQTLQLLDGLVDIYLPDFKYADSRSAEELSAAPDYPETAKAAIAEMVRQTGDHGCLFDDRGMMTRGVIVRHLLLPGHVSQAKQIAEYLYHTYKDRIYLSLLNQYTPMPRVKDHPLLSRKVTKREYEKLIAHVLSIGVEQAFIQEGETAGESFIPSFDLTGTGENG